MLGDGKTDEKGKKRGARMAEKGTPGSNPTPNMVEGKGRDVVREGGGGRG